MITKKQRYFGITKIRQGAKMCWLAKQDKNGWALGLALSKRNVWLTGLRFKTMEDLKAAIDSNIAFIHLKNTDIKA